jgi:hypothetical protein
MPLKYIYLLRECEAVKSDENIYRIGKTKNLHDLINSFPEKPEIILVLPADYCDHSEKEIRKVFKKNFKIRKDIGPEYFQGDVDKMCYRIKNITHFSNNPCTNSDSDSDSNNDMKIHTVEQLYDKSSIEKILLFDKKKITGILKFKESIIWHQFSEEDLKELIDFNYNKSLMNDILEKCHHERYNYECVKSMNILLPEILKGIVWDYVAGPQEYYRPQYDFLMRELNFRIKYVKTHIDEGGINHLLRPLYSRIDLDPEWIDPALQKDDPTWDYEWCNLMRDIKFHKKDVVKTW